MTTQALTPIDDILLSNVQGGVARVGQVHPCWPEIQAVRDNPSGQTSLELQRCQYVKSR